MGCILLRRRAGRGHRHRRDYEYDGDAGPGEAPVAKAVQRQGILLGVRSAADDEEDVDEDLDEFLAAEVPAEPAGDEGEETLDDDDLYADLAEFMRPSDVAQGREGDGGEEGDGILPAELGQSSGTTL